MTSNIAEIDLVSYREKVTACWLGKAVGGTLGAPYEGGDGPHALTFYDPVPKEMLPNDDLDLQVLWACALDSMDTPVVDRHVLSSFWTRNVEFSMDEYGVAIRNLQLGIPAPLSGAFDNWFSCGMGAAIRSEVWACLAPGDPALAAAYAYEDACVDHTGEGVWAEVFFATVESAAFLESSPDALIEIGLDRLPEDSLIKSAVADTRKWWSASQDWLTVREQILEHYGHENFTDVTMNVAFTVLALLAGGGDFGRTICIATNCGKDTDCTAATAGSILGIIDPASVSEEWLRPIGRSLVVSPEIIGISPPASLDGFTDLIIRLRDKLKGQMPDPQEQTVDGEFYVPAEIDYISYQPGPGSPVPTLSPDATPVELPGTFAVHPVSDFSKSVLVVKYRFTLSESRRVRVMFNSPQDCRVWVDGHFAFGRECGSMAPSFHRLPINQSADLSLEAGEHEIVATVKKPLKGAHVSWVVGVGDVRTSQWLPETIYRKR